MPEHTGRCFGCDYLLHHLTEHRCPECGRPFHPANATTMNMSGRPLGTWGRRLLQPPLRLLLLPLIALILVHAWFVRLPGPLSYITWKYLLGAWIALSVTWALFGLAAAICAGRFRPPQELCHRPIRWLAFPLLALAVLAFLLTGMLFRLEILLSKPALDRFAKTTLASPLRDSYPARRVGLFSADQIYATPTDLGFEIRLRKGTPAISEYHAGLIYSPGRPPAADTVVPFNRRPPAHLIGDWYFYETGPLNPEKRQWDRQRLAKALAADPTLATRSVQALVDLLRQDAWWRMDFSAVDTGFRSNQYGYDEPDIRAFGFGPLRPDVVALTRVGRPAVLPLIPALNDPVSRPHALFVLGEIGPAAADAVPFVTSFLASPDPHTREIAACTLGRIGPPAHRATADLFKLLDDPEPIVAANAIQALRSIHPEAPDAILPAAAYLRRAAVPGATPARGTWIREQCFALLVDYAAESAPAVPDILALYRQLQQPFDPPPPPEFSAPAFSRLCLQFLLRHDPANAEFKDALALLQTKYVWHDPLPPAPPPVPLMFTASPAQLVNLKSSLPAIMFNLHPHDGGSTGVKETAAVEALGRIGPLTPEIVTELAAVIDPEKGASFLQERAAAIAALAQFGPAAAPALPALERASLFDQSLRLRHAAAEALTRLRAAPSTAPRTPAP